MNISPATITAILPLALGGVFSYFKPFLEDQKEFKNRGTKILTRSVEDISIALLRLLQTEVRAKGFDDVSRGDGDSTPDLYDDVASAIARHSKQNFRVSRRLFIFRYCYSILLIGLIIGLLAFIASLVTSSFGGLILGTCLTVSTAQVIAVVVLYTLTRRSEDDEEVL